MKRDIQVINLCNDHNVSILNEYREKYGISPAVLMTDIMDTYRNPDYDGSVYLITQFISDRIRKSGIDGIKFKSSITNGTNDITMDQIRYDETATNPTDTKYAVVTLENVATKTWFCVDNTDEVAASRVIEDGNDNGDGVDAQAGTTVIVGKGKTQLNIWGQVSKSILIHLPFLCPAAIPL